MAASIDAQQQKVSRSIEIAAPASRVYELISDLPRMGEWSPECYRCDWQAGATGASVGARFKGRNRLGILRWTTNGEVVIAEPDRAVAFDVSLAGLPVARWSYEIDELEPGRVQLTESWQDQRTLPMKVMGLATGVRDRATHNAAGMEKTLARLKEASES